MATLDLEDGRVVVRFTPKQALMGLARQVSVPVRDVRSVTVVPDGWAVDLGSRVGGTGVPRRLAFGRYRRRGIGRTFAALYRGRPALVIETTGGDWDRLAIALDDGDTDATAARVREAAGLG